MGQSTDAYLFYGYCFGESEPWVEDVESEDSQDEDWGTVYARAVGLKEPDVAYPSRGVPRTKANNYDSTPKDYTPDELAAIEAHRAFWKEKREAVAKSGVIIDTHCSCEYPMYYICIQKSQLSASRGDTVEVTSLAVEPTWNDELKAFAKLMNIKIEGEPKWWLVSNWC